MSGERRVSAEGYEVLEKAFQGVEYSQLDAAGLKRKREDPRKRRTVPTSYATIPSSEESETTSEDEFARRNDDKKDLARGEPFLTFDRPMLRPVEQKSATPPHLVQERSGLPPTPPTMANSDDAEPTGDSVARNQQFADAVRDALHARKSSLSTPGRQLPTPDVTPDPSPPATRENFDSTSLQLPSTSLQPFTTQLLRQYPSSRADSFHTARENASSSQVHLPDTPSPELPSLQHWLDSTRGTRLHNLDLTESIHNPSTPPISHQQESEASPESTPTRPRRVNRPVSPYLALRTNSDWDKHISYISDETSDPQASAEDVNNLIYKQIQEENVKRHSSTMFPDYAARQSRLRRITGAESLRALSETGDSEHDSPKLRHKNATIQSRSLEASPVVDEPARRECRRVQQQTLGDDALGMARLTLAAMAGEEATKSAASPAVDHPRWVDEAPRPRTQRQHTLRRSPKGDTWLESLSHAPRKSLDAHFLHPSTTPVSVSQLSDRTDIEVCEARGISIYPHNNDSLLVVQHGSRPSSKEETTPPPAEDPRRHDSDWMDLPSFIARVTKPSPTLGPVDPAIHVDSPLTNPRLAPEPPMFKVIPPTPSSELDRQLSPDENVRPGGLQRRESLAQRARRYSESFIVQPLFGRSVSQKRRAVDDNEARPVNLSPLWKPRYFWDGYDSDEEEYDEEGTPVGRLPEGGDTSDVDDSKQRTFIPRNMSVRMPGFRGQGGFLLGNSLGLDRHGTNNRRHYVTRSQDVPSSAVRSSPNNGSYVDEERKRIGDRGEIIGGGPIFTVPFTGGMQVQYVGLSPLRERMNEMRMKREQRAREKRAVALLAKLRHAPPPQPSQ